ncbi:MAG: acetate--CoA ligase [Alphaproteobacteria bacterium]
MDQDSTVFSWSAVRGELGGASADGFNIAYAAVDRHVEQGRGGKVALRWLGRTGETKDITYAELKEQSDRFANVLMSLGVLKGDAVFALTERIPELYVAALGTFKAGGVFSPMFSAFGPEPIRTRMTLGDAKVLVTTGRLYRRKVAPIHDKIESLKHVLLVPDEEAPDQGDDTDNLHTLMAQADTSFQGVPTRAEDIAILHFTSGTTGTPKGAVHVHEAALVHYATARYALDLGPKDVFWCTADPGWVTGTSYGIIAPLVIGATMVIDQADFDALRWYQILQDQKVTVWYTAPTAIRMLMKAGDDVPKQYDLSTLRFVASVGEPLNPEAVHWGDRVLGKIIHDNWWQTETGGIMIANDAASAIKPGSMGRPVPGIEAAIVEHDGGTLKVINEPDREGELVLKPGWPSMFRTYLNQQERYDKCFQDGWYLTGDVARRDADGYYWFVGRADDVIKSAGHLIGPFEVESTLMELPAVAEAAVVGLPDDVAGEVVKAYVTLNAGYEASESLKREIIGHARKKLGPAIAPRDLAFRDNLPVTRSGKIMRRLLKARELGLPEGDLSTLERSK